MKRFSALMMALMLVFSISVSSAYATQVYVVSPGYEDPDPDLPVDPGNPGGPGNPDDPDPDLPVDPGNPGGPGKPGDPDPGAPGKPGKPVGPDSPKPGKPVSPQTGYVMGSVGLSAVAAASGAVAVVAGKKASKRD